MFLVPSRRLGWQGAFVNAEAEDFLNLMLWSADKFFRPTFRNLTESYEGWAYRNGLLRKVGRLEKRRLVERDKDSPNHRLYRLTAEGRLHALGGRDPEVCWARAWDGSWRVVLYDVPNHKSNHRTRLRQYLRTRGFGYLQKSVWISPHPLTQEQEILKGGDINVESFLLLEGKAHAGESDHEIVLGAWDFNEINRLYTQHLNILNQHSSLSLKSPLSFKSLLKWAASERRAWLRAVKQDPLLPNQLVPSNYLGKKAWHQRIELLQQSHRQLVTLQGN